MKDHLGCRPEAGLLKTLWPPKKGTEDDEKDDYFERGELSPLFCGTKAHPARKLWLRAAEWPVMSEQHVQSRKAEVVAAAAPERLARSR